MMCNRLKTKFQKNTAVAVCSAVLASSLLITGGSCTVYAAKNTEEETNIQSLAEGVLGTGAIHRKDNVEKEETVYVLADASGDADKIIVSDHLLNREKQDVLSDKTTLSNIENVKGDESYTDNGGTITWQANGKEIFYRGTTDAKPPVTQKITYYLDNRELKPEELAGQSGAVRIRFDYENQADYTEEINGKNVTVKVPFAAISAVMLGEDFKNIEVTNGRVKSISGGNLAVGYALPGMADSLNLNQQKSGGLTVPEYFEIKADVENFSMDTALTFVVNAGSVAEFGNILPTNAGDTVKKLGDASAQLADGSKDLSAGMGTLTDGLNSYLEGSEQLNAGINALAEKAGVLAGGTGKLNDGAQNLYGNMGNLADGLNALSGKSADIKTYMLLGLQYTLDQKVNLDADGDGMVDWIAGLYMAAGIGAPTDRVTTENIGNYVTLLTGDYAAQIEGALGSEVYGELLGGVRQVAAGVEAAKSLPDHIAALDSGAQQLYAGAGQLAGGTKSLADAMPELIGGVEQLANGSNELIKNNEALKTGAKKLSEGSDTLAANLFTFNEEGIQKLVDVYEGDVTDLLDRAKAIADAGEQYGAFTSAADGVVADTQFIYRTAGISE